MLRSLILACLMSAMLWAADLPGPSGFYVVSATFSDHGALFYHRVVAVRQDGPDSVVRYIRIASGNVYCPRNVVQAVETRVRGKSPAQLIGSNNPCAINSKTFHETLRKPATKDGVFETTSFGIVAKCGGSTVSLRLPIPEEVDLASLKSTHPAMARLWKLYYEIAGIAFCKSDPFEVLSESDDLTLHKAGESLVPDLRSGLYDRGLQQARSGNVGKAASLTFGNLLSGYHGPITKSEARGYDDPKLENAEPFHFLSYNVPRYPPLALQARISGKVELSLTVDPVTGIIQDAVAIQSHPLLAQSATESAKHWRFEPGSVPDKTVNVTVSYSLNCTR
jgi:TonB family protein